MSSPVSSSPVMSERVSQVGPQRDLGWEELTDVIDLALWTGKLMLEHGASAPRVERTVELVGTSLGCDQLDILVSPNVIMATTSEGLQFRTKARRVAALHVNIARVANLGDLVRDVSTGRCGRQKLRERLEAIASSEPEYSRLTAVVMVGLACAAFSRLFGGDWPTFGIVWVAASAGMAVRQVLAARRYAPVLNVLAVSFTASLISAFAAGLVHTSTPEHALAASVLLLVPGVPLINAFEELVRGYSLMAVSRGVQGLAISLAIALGMLVATSWLGANAL
jgi:uncharacterized membrane protein YjjP (DUF1212 family)